MNFMVRKKAKLAFQILLFVGVAGAGGAALYFFVFSGGAGRVPALLPGDTAVYFRVTGIDRLESTIGKARLLRDTKEALEMYRDLVRKTLPEQVAKKFEVDKGLAERLAGSLSEFHVAVLELEVPEPRTGKTGRGRGFGAKVVAFLRIDASAFSRFIESAKSTSYSFKGAKVRKEMKPAFARDSEYRGHTIHSGTIGFTAPVKGYRVVSPSREVLQKVVDAAVDGLPHSLAANASFKKAHDSSASPAGLWIFAGKKVVKPIEALTKRLGLPAALTSSLAAFEAAGFGIGDTTSGVAVFAGDAHKKYMLPATEKKLLERVPPGALAVMSMTVKREYLQLMRQSFEKGLEAASSFAGRSSSRRRPFGRPVPVAGARKVRSIFGDPAVKKVIDRFIDNLTEEAALFVDAVEGGKKGPGFVQAVGRGVGFLCKMKDPAGLTAALDEVLGDKIRKEGSGDSACRVLVSSGIAVGFSGDVLVIAGSKALYQKVLAKGGKGIAGSPGFVKLGIPAKTSMALAVNLSGLLAATKPGLEKKLADDTWVGYHYVHGEDRAVVRATFSWADLTGLIFQFARAVRSRR